MWKESFWLLRLAAQCTKGGNGERKGKSLKSVVIAEVHELTHLAQFVLILFLCLIARAICNILSDIFSIKSRYIRKTGVKNAASSKGCASVMATRCSLRGVFKCSFLQRHGRRDSQSQLVLWCQFGVSGPLDNNELLQMKNKQQLFLISAKRHMRGASDSLLFIRKWEKKLHRAFLITCRTH